MDKSKALDDAFTGENRIESIELNDNLMRPNDSKTCHKPCDSEIDTELDNLLDVTSEAMQYPLNIVKNVLPGDDLTNDKYGQRKQNQRMRKLYKENCTTSSDDKNMHEHVKVKQEKGPVVIAKSENDDYDVSSQDISEQSHRFNKQDVKADAKNKDEILKFTCQMMEIKQPKLMSRKKHSQKSAPAERIENMHKPEEKESIKNDTDKFDYEKVEELNRKSQELFRKVIQDRKKKSKKHTTLMNLDPESDRRRIRKQKERANKLRIHEELAADARENTNFYKDEQIVDDTEDDVFDISPTKNRASFSDSEPDNSNALEHDSDDNKDSIILENTLPETHRLKPAKSYTILKYDRNTSIKDMVVRSKSFLKGEQTKERRSKFRMAKGDNCDKNKNVQNNLNEANFENDTRGKQSGTDLDKHRIVNEKNKGKFMKEFSENKNEMHDDTENKNILLNVLARGTDKFVKIENDSKDNRPEIELGDLMYDSDTDTIVDSDYNSDQDYFSRPPTVESRDTGEEFPRPASNRTFILYSDEANCPYSIPEYVYDETTMETGMNDYKQVEMKEEKKFILQRFLNWITCVRPKTGS